MSGLTLLSFMSGYVNGLNTTQEGTDGFMPHPGPWLFDPSYFVKRVYVAGVPFVRRIMDSGYKSSLK